MRSALKKTSFIVKPHGLSGRIYNNNVAEALPGVLDSLLSKGAFNILVCYDTVVYVGYSGSKSAVKKYIKNHKHLVPFKRQLVSPRGDRGRRYEISPGESYSHSIYFTSISGDLNYIAKERGRGALKRR